MAFSFLTVKYDLKWIHRLENAGVQGGCKKQFRYICNNFFDTIVYSADMAPINVDLFTV